MALSHRGCRRLVASAAMSILMLTTWPVAAQAPDAAAHKAWMNDASDAQEDYRFALSDKDQKAAVDALGKLDALMAKTEAYWTTKKVADGERLARAAHGLSTAALAAATRGDMAAAGQNFDKLGATCNSCHDLHLEKR